MTEVDWFMAGFVAFPLAFAMGVVVVLAWDRRGSNRTSEKETSRW